jgi:hypothetical protein
MSSGRSQLVEGWERQGAVDLAGDVAFEAAEDLGLVMPRVSTSFSVREYSPRAGSAARAFFGRSSSIQHRAAMRRAAVGRAGRGGHRPGFTGLTCSREPEPILQ